MRGEYVVGHPALFVSDTVARNRNRAPVFGLAVLNGRTVKISRLYILILAAVLLGACGREEGSGEGRRQEARTPPEDSSAVAPGHSAVDTSQSGTLPGPSHGSSDTAPTILFLGNSLSAGLGVEPGEAFPSLIQKRIEAMGWNFRVRNAGLSGDTSSGGLRRIDWLLQQPVDVLVLELGGNDGLRGIRIDVIRQNLSSIIEKTRQAYPDVDIIITGMQIPPNLGRDYTRAFRDMYADLAKEYEALLVPFLMDGVGGIDAMMQNDGIHPTAEGHQIMADNIWETLEPVLRRRLAPQS